MLFSQFLFAAISIFVTPFTIMAVALLVQWYHGQLFSDKVTPNSSLSEAEA